MNIKKKHKRIIKILKVSIKKELVNLKTKMKICNIWLNNKKITCKLKYYNFNNRIKFIMINSK